MPFILKAQLPLSNDGALISIKDGAMMSVHGDVYNQNNGFFHNSDTIYLFEDWINIAGNEGFNSLGEGIVILNGSNQRIRGNDITRFYDLRLQETGIKFGDLDVYVDGFLQLNDREFNLDTNTVHVFNTDLNAVTNNQGFVSSLNNGGLLRDMTNNQAYFFPVGSSIGSLRYRPVYLSPSSSNANTFKIRMAHLDATLDAFDRDQKDSIICEINSFFYHRIWRVQGTDSVQTQIYYDEGIDGTFDSIAHWQGPPKWEITGDVNAGFDATENLNYLQTVNYIDDFSFPAFALANIADSLDLDPNMTAACEGETFTFNAPTGFINYDFFVNEIMTQSGSNNVFSSILDDGDRVRAVAWDGECLHFSQTISVTIYMNEITLSADTLSACDYDTITFTGSPGFNNYDFLVNGISTQSGPSSIFATSDLNDGDLVQVIGTDDFCDYESNILQITIYTNSISLSADVILACEGDPFTFTANGVFNTYEFFVNGVSVQNTNANIYTSPLNDGDVVYVIGTDDFCDYQSNSITVNLFMHPIELTVMPDIVCEGDTLIFTATPGFNTYDFYIDGGLIQTGASNELIIQTLDNMNMVTVHGTDDNCTFISNAVSVMIYKKTLDLTASDLEICEGESIIFTASGGFNTYEFFINFTEAQTSSSNVFTANNLMQGDQIFVRATDENCTYESEILTVNVFQNSIDIALENMIVCEGDTLIFSASSGFTNYDFFIDSLLVQSGNSDTYTGINLSDSISIYVEGFDGNCTYASNSISFSYFDDMVFLEADQTAFCEGGIANVMASPGFDNYDFYLNDFLIQSGAANDIQLNDLSDQDQLFAIASFNTCIVNSDTLTFTIHPSISIQAFGDTTIVEGAVAPLSATGAASYQWTPTEFLNCTVCPNPLASPEETSVFYVSGQSEFGCGDVDSVFVNIIPPGEFIPFIPNAITINDDGKNDTWNIRFLDAFPENEVVILNRWGDKLYSAKPYTNGFDGTFQGKKLPRGTYYYILRVNMDNQYQTFKGPLTIIR